MQKKPTGLTNPPDNPLDYLVGRETDLKELHKLVLEKKKAVIVKSMGGIGKTTLLKAYFHTYGSGYDHYAYLPTASFATPEDSTQDEDNRAFVNAFLVNPVLMERLNLPLRTDLTEGQRFQQALHALSEVGGHNLLLIDNVGNVATYYLDAVSALEGWEVVMTSRMHFERFAEYALGHLDEAAAVGLFYRHFTKEKDDATVTAIVQKVNRHTLTVELLAKTGQQAYPSLAALWADIEQKSLLHLRSAKVETSHSPFRNTLQEHLLSAFAFALPDERKRVLRWFAVLPAVPINKFDLIEWCEIEADDERDTISEAINRLADFGWLERDGDLFTCHNVIQELVKERIEVRFEDCAALAKTIRTKMQVNYSKGEHGIFKQSWLPFGESLIKNFQEENQIMMWLYDNLGWVYFALGNYALSVDYRKMAVDMGESILGEDKESLSTLYNDLGYALISAGDFDKSIVYLEKSVAIDAEVWGENNIETATTYDNLGQVFRKIKKYDESLSYFEKAIAIRENVLGKNHIQTSVSYNNISPVYQALGEYEKGLRYSLKSFEICKQSLDWYHPYMAIALWNLAVTYYSLKDYPKALGHIRQAIEIQQKLLPENHPDLKSALGWKEAIEAAMEGGE